MKAGFEIKSAIGYVPNEKYFCVTNYETMNIVYTYGFETKEEAMCGDCIVGVWQPKGTNKNNKPKQL